MAVENQDEVTLSGLDRAIIGAARRIAKVNTEIDALLRMLGMFQKPDAAFVPGELLDDGPFLPHQALHRVGRGALRLAIGIDQNMLEFSVPGKAEKLFGLKPGIVGIASLIENHHADLSPDTPRVRFVSRLPRELRRMNPAGARRQQRQWQ